MDKEGELLNFWPMAEKAMCQLLKIPDVSWGSYCWVVVGVAGMSVLAHVPTPPATSSSSRHMGREATFPFSPLSHDSILPFTAIFRCFFLSHIHVGAGLAHPHAESCSPNFFVFPHAQGSPLVLFMLREGRAASGHDYAVYVKSLGFSSTILGFLSV